MRLTRILIVGAMGALAYFYLKKKGALMSGSALPSTPDLPVSQSFASKVSQNAIDLLKKIEGFSAAPYFDVKGWSIGFGHFMGATKKLLSTTTDQAEALLRKDLGGAESVIKRYVKVPLSQNMYDALCLFIYNIGETNFANSTVLKKLNAGDKQGAADAFALFNKVRDKNKKLVVSPTLVARRETESNLFMS